MTKQQLSSTGACGEFYVAAFLTRHGLLVALPRAGVQGIDLFVVGGNSERHMGIQVKTTADGYGVEKGVRFCSWTQSYLTEEHSVDTTWYAYVNLNKWREVKENHPDIFFVPSSLVVSRMEEIRIENVGKKEWRTFFWMLTSDLDQYKNESGLNLLKLAMKSS